MPHALCPMPYALCPIPSHYTGLPARQRLTIISIREKKSFKKAILLCHPLYLHKSCHVSDGLSHTPLQLSKCLANSTPSREAARVFVRSRLGGNLFRQADESLCEFAQAGSPPVLYVFA